MGRIIFSTKNTLQEELRNTIQSGDQMKGVVTYRAASGWIGIAENGLGICFDNGDDYDLDAGSVVEIEFQETSVERVIFMSLIVEENVGVWLNQVEIVANMAADCGEELLPENKPSEEEEVFVSNSLFTAEQLDELLLVYDQIAQREVNLLRRYHYVSAARLLAKLTDRAERVEFYEKWRACSAC